MIVGLTAWFVLGILTAWAVSKYVQLSAQMRVAVYIIGGVVIATLATHMSRSATGMPGAGFTFWQTAIIVVTTLALTGIVKLLSSGTLKRI